MDLEGELTLDLGLEFRSNLRTHFTGKGRLLLLNPEEECSQEDRSSLPFDKALF